MRTILTLCCLLVVFPAPLSGQAAAGTLAQLAPGTRVRVSAPALSEFGLKGSVWATSPDTLYLATSGEITHAVPLHAIERLEVSRGRTQSTLIGAGVGALAFGTFGYYGSQVADRTQRPGTGRQVAEVGVSAAVGALAGALVGALLGERWRQVFP
jgi:MFS family permease